MNRNPQNKHLKRINAPNNWLLDKLSGVWAPRPSPGPHKLRECLPIIIMLRNRLKYALTAREVKMIVLSRHIRVDGKVRTDTKFPCGFQDVVTINRTAEHFRLIYDTKGRFHLHRIPVEEANWKLLKVVKKGLGARAIPYIVTHDGRTIPYPRPDIKINDTIKYDFMTNKILDVAYFKPGCQIMVTGGRNVGRVGVLEDVERHPGSFDMVHIHDKKQHKFATRKDNVFVIGFGQKSLVTLPKTQGVKLNIVEDRKKRLEKQANPIPNQNDRKKLTKGTILPPRVVVLRKQTREKNRLLKLLKREDEKKNKASKNKPNVKKNKKKKADAAK